MILSYNERYDLFRVAYYSEEGELIIDLYEPVWERWETSYLQNLHLSMTGFRNDLTHKNGIAIIIYDDGEE